MRLALRFISGKYQGGEFPLERDGEVVVGRSSDLDMVLVEEMVSRRHARFYLSEGELSIEDLGSTNGTFVNGERITHAKLEEGDRILVGSNILKVVPADASTAESGAEPVTPAHRSSSDARMRGDLQEIPLPDLMQLFGSSRKTGTLVVSSAGRQGRLHLREGVVHAAELAGEDGQPLPVVGLKIIYRMLGWEAGMFELMPAEEREFEQPLDASVQEVLMEGFRQKDELSQLEGRLPEGGASLNIPKPFAPRLAELNELELDVFQVALHQHTVQEVLDASPRSDLDTAQVLLQLLERGYLAA